MPYVIRRPGKRRSTVPLIRASVLALLSTAVAGLAATPAIADGDGHHARSSFDQAAALLAAPADTSSCSAPALTQAFLSWGDQNLYTLVSGQSQDSFDGTGWTLLGNANTATTDLSDGTSGPVLDLPSGSAAISPNVCVASNYLSARVMARQVAGDENLRVFVSYANGDGWTFPRRFGPLTGVSSDWAPSDPIALNPAQVAGWQVVRFVFLPVRDSEFQLYNLYVDPYSRG